MKKIKLIVGLSILLITSNGNAQQPVKYELVKLAETVVPPPLTPSEAYMKCEVKGGVDEKRMFGSFYDRMRKIGMELNTLTGKQIKQNNTDKNTAEEAMASGFGEMSASQQAQYLKNHPELQKSTGVSSSMMELAAMMEDPVFKKKFDAMSDDEKAKLVKQYQQPSIVINKKIHSQEGLKTVMEAAKLIDQFNRIYYKSGISHFGKERLAKENELDVKEELALKPVLEEKRRLMQKMGKGISDADSRRLKEVIAQGWTIRNNAFEKKLRLYKSEVHDLITRFKSAAQPFDDFLAKINYGNNLNATNEAKELRQLAGYQEGLLNIISNIEDIAKNITLLAAQFYKEMLDAENGK